MFEDDLGRALGVRVVPAGDRLARFVGFSHERCGAVRTVDIFADPLELIRRAQNAVGHLRLATDLGQLGDHHEDVVHGARA